MEKKFIFILVTIVLVSFSPQIFADEEIGTVIKEDTIVFEVGKDGKVHVSHIVKSGAWQLQHPKFLQILLGEHSNLAVKDEDGDRLSFGYKESTEKGKFTQLNQKAAGLDLIVSYDLEQYLQNENGIWEKHFRFPMNVMILFEDDIDLAFATGRPLDLTDAKGINCIGCDLMLEFFDNDSILKKEIVKNEKKFYIDVLSNGKISQMEFNEASELLTFNVDERDQLIVLKIPFELMLNPYEVYFTDKDDYILDQIDKIRKSEFAQNEDSVKITFRTTDEGTISILGGTPEQHQKKLEQIEKRTMASVESESIDKEKGVPLPFGEIKQDVDEGDEAEVGLSFIDRLEEKQDVVAIQDNTIIYIITGAVVAIIVGIIIKLKKN